MASLVSCGGGKSTFKKLPEAAAAQEVRSVCALDFQLSRVECPLVCGASSSDQNNKREEERTENTFKRQSS